MTENVIFEWDEEKRMRNAATARLYRVVSFNRI